jgi:hypothetical protein
MFPLPSSVVVDAVPGARCVDFSDGTRPRFDQNGDLRQGGAAPTITCYIGAIEGAIAPPAPEIFANSFEPAP